MCGIAGFFKLGDTTKEQDKDIFEIATALFDETKSRGRDASGFSYFKDNGELVTTKGPIHSGEMIKNPLWTKIGNHVPHSMIMHCRAMTKGSEYDNMNNHPLVIDKRISVVHNGGIWNDDNLREQFSLPSKGQVDSEVIPMMINKYLNDISGFPAPASVNNARAINLTSQSIMGSYACAMINRDVPNMLYLFNHKNPVTLAYVETLNTIFFSSTKSIMTDAFSTVSNKVTVFNVFSSVKHSPMVYEVPDDTLIVLGVHEKQIDAKDELIKNATVVNKHFAITLYDLFTNPETPYNKSSVTKDDKVTEDVLRKLLTKKGTRKPEPAPASTYTASYPASSRQGYIGFRDEKDRDYEKDSRYWGWV